MPRFLLVWLALTLGNAALAQRIAPPADTLYAADYDAFTFVAPPAASALRGTARAQFDLDLSGFPPAAEAAFAFAAGIWATHIESPIPIRVRAVFSSLEAQTLAATGPACVEAGPELPVPNTWYAVALAEAILGEDLNPLGAEVCPGVDITATFNSDVDWYFGTDGSTPRGRYDFATVVLHELGHGLGFFGSFSVVTDGEDGACPALLGEVSVGEGCWGFGSDALRPLIFDRFAEDATGVSLLDTNVYPNPSLALGTVLRSDAVFFDGPSATPSNAAVPIDLFAPSNFEPGSSFSHLDEAVSPAGDANSLMTPFLARAEAIFSPGPFTCAIFRDIGWPLGPDCRALLEGGLSSFTARVTEGDVVLTFRLGLDSEFVTAVLEQEGADGRFEPVDVAIAPLDPSGSAAYTVRVPGLEQGVYAFRLRLTRADGTEVVSQPLVVSVLDGAFALAVYPNPFADVATVEVIVADAQDVRVDVYDTLGRRVAQLFDGTVVSSPTGALDLRWDGQGLAAGVYFVRAVGETFGVTRTVTRIR
ncbi:MAG: T9SS type A sorting domain-containing protein [Rhodothermales bacterium]